jgi:hypothetical protein
MAYGVVLLADVGVDDVVFVSVVAVVTVVVRADCVTVVSFVVVAVVAGFTIDVVFPMLTELVGVDCVLEELPLDASAMTTTITATTTATPPAIAQPPGPDRRSGAGIDLAPGAWGSWRADSSRGRLL